MFSDGQTIDLVLQAHEQANHQVRMTCFIGRRADGKQSQALDVASAVGRDPASAAASDLSPAECQVVANEIAAGLSAARKVAAQRSADASAGWHVELVSVGVSHGDDHDLAATPSIAFAVGASLCLLQASGCEDLESAPRGGHGWDLRRIAIA